jgi:TIR domain
MLPLAKLPNLVGFFSYSREDDEGSDGALSKLRGQIQRELRAQLGRSIMLWQDKEAIAAGRLWESDIKDAVAQSVFFIPIITPTVARSENCRFELEAFQAREAELGRDDLVFPILYIRVPELDDSVAVQNDPVLSIIAKRQYVDWRSHRQLEVNSREVKEAVERFCANVCGALRQSWLSPEEWKAQEEAERKRQEAEAKQEELAKWDRITASERQDLRGELSRTKLETLLWRFLEEFPRSAHAAEAKSKLAELERQAREARKAEKRKSGETDARALVNAVVGSFARAPAQDEASAWAKLPQPPSILALRRFLKEFPSGAHAAEAKSKLAELEHQAREANKPEERKKGETEASVLVKAVLRYIRRPTS